MSNEAFHILQAEETYEWFKKSKELTAAMSTTQSLLKGRSKFKTLVWKISFIYNKKVPATEELDSTNIIEDALVIMISPTMVPSHKS